MKQIKALLLAALLVVFSTGCCVLYSATQDNQGASYQEKVEEVQPESYALRYQRFDGEAVYNFTLLEDVLVAVEVETLSGELDIYLVQREDTQRETPYIFQEDAETMMLGGQLPAGDYALIGVGREHEGGYGVVWGDAAEALEPTEGAGT